MMSPVSLSAIYLFIATLALTCNRFAQPLAVVSPSTTATVKPTTLLSNRVFVAGISHNCTEQTLRSTFSEFGPVTDLLIVGQDEPTQKRKRLPYCFVTFEDVSSATRAVTAPRSDTNGAGVGVGMLYKEVQYAMPKDDSKRTRSNEAKAEERERVAKVEALGRDTNLIVQVQTTHADRLAEYLHQWNNNGQSQSSNHRLLNSETKNGDGDDVDDVDNNSCRVLGSTSANRKNISLLFLSCGNPTDMTRKLHINPLLARAINKSYIVQPGLPLEGNLATEEGCNKFAKMLYEKVSHDLKKDTDEESGEPVVLRLQVFPPKHQSRLLQTFDSIIDENNASDRFTISPKGFSHMISVAEVYQYKGRGWELRQQDDDNKLYMIGMSPASLELDVVDTNNIIAEDGSGDNVNRAYYKLKEAFETYEARHRGGMVDEDLYGSIAMDCGSAPGGWTKYLIERCHCQKVHSIDPGALSLSVLKLKETSHMQMKIQDALPLLLEDEAAAGKVKIWVSDMCLHAMKEQIDQLLLAREKGLLAPNAFFVLTLKCVVGRSKNSFDEQVKKVVDELCASANVSGLETFHLFSNRSGERTVIGYIN